MPGIKIPPLLKQWFESYEVREGNDGKLGIYTKEFNCRLATFNSNTHCLSSRLKLFFAKCNEPTPKKRKSKPRKRRPPLQPGDIDVMGTPPKDDSFRSLRLLRRIR